MLYGTVPTKQLFGFFYRKPDMAGAILHRYHFPLQQPDESKEGLFFKIPRSTAAGPGTWR